MHVDHLIIGAGPSGLTLADQLIKQGKQVLILEGSSYVGGLCKTLTTDDGAVFDVGGHSFHTPYRRVQQFVEELMAPYDGMFWQKRDAKVFFNNQVLPYPFQQHANLIKNNLIREECLSPATGGELRARNFEEYIKLKFSKGVADYFMLPYNKKIWKTDLKLMSTDWTSQRIADKEEESFEDAEHRIALQPSTHVGYPLKHGFEQIFVSIAAGLPKGSILTDSIVTSLDLPNRVAIYSRMGRTESIEYGTLYSTMPLDRLIDYSVRAPKEVGFIHKDLKYLSMILLSVEVKNYNVSAPQRLYVAGSEATAHKIAFNNKSSEWWNLSDRKAVMCEISFIKKKPSYDDILANIGFLASAGFINVSDVTNVNTSDITYAYPIYTLTRKQIVDFIKEYLSRFGVYTLGRFGSWQYVNSDACIEEAFALAEAL